MMKKRKKQVLYFFGGLMMLTLLIGSCNLPGQPEPEEPAQGLVFTAAAQTIVSQYTQAVIEQPVATEVPTEATEDLPEPSYTPEPTWTPEPSPTSAPTDATTPTAIPNTILEDDFSNTSLWYATKEDEYGFEYSDGGYRIYNKILNGAIWSVRFLSYQDIRVEVDAVRLDGPDDGYYGVVCRLGNDGNDYYALVIGNNGFYGLMKMEDSEQEFLVSGIDDDDIIHREPGAVNRIRGICSGDHLELVVNEHQLIETFDNSFTSGDVGIVAGNRLSGVGIDVLFDNFALVWP